MNTNNKNDYLRERIELALSNRKVDKDNLSEKTFLEVIEEISVYHQELDFQNQELLRINEELSALRKQYYDLFDLAPSGYVVFSMDTTILLANQKFISMFGLRKHELKIRMITEFIHPECQDEFYFHTQKLLKEKEVQSIELLMIAKERTIPVVLRSNLMMDGDSLSVRCEIIDMTKEKEASEQLLQLNQELQNKTLELERLAIEADQASQAKSQFLANMSHEIRTPMNAILGMAELLGELATTEEQVRYVEIIRRNGEHLTEIISDILDLSRIESGMLSLKNEPINVCRLIRETQETYQLIAKNKGLAISITAYDCNPEEYCILGDEDKLRQILVNLVGNAIKYTKEGTIVLGVKRVVTLEGYLLQFSVRDTGIGIPKDKLEDIFSNFTQVDSSNTRKHGGVGLGLAICKKLVSLMNGTIWVESEVGLGSTFYFEIPYIGVTDASACKREQLYRK